MNNLTKKNILNFLEIDHFYEGSLFKIHGKSFIKNNNYIYVFRVTKMNCAFLSKMRLVFHNEKFFVYFFKKSYLLVFLRYLLLFYLIEMRKDKQLLKEEENKMLFNSIGNISNGSFFFVELNDLQDFMCFENILSKYFPNDIVPWYIKTGSQFLTYEIFNLYLDCIPKDKNKLIFFGFFRVFFFYKILLYLINFFKLENFLLNKVNF